MPHISHLHSRRQFLVGASATALILPFGNIAHAQGLGLGLGRILGGASDNALDKLSQPNAYYNDEDIRVGLPFVGGKGGLLGSILNGAQELGLLDGIIRTVNDAAGVAASEAKPIFRNAIGDISFNDVPGIARESDGGTQYLRRSANDDLHAKLSPLIDNALGDLGAYNQLDDLSARHSFVRRAGLSREGMNRTVTDQGLDGIFSYMGSEEKALRANPLGTLGDVFGDIF